MIWLAYIERASGSGVIINNKVGENLKKYVLVYLKHDTGLWMKADPVSLKTCARGITIDNINANQKGRILLDGFIGKKDWNWQREDPVYLSSTPGELSQMSPTGLYIQIVGRGMSDSRHLMFNPEEPTLEPVGGTPIISSPPPGENYKKVLNLFAEKIDGVWKTKVRWDDGL